MHGGRGADVNEVMMEIKMDCMTETKFGRGLKYATVFDERLFGVGCDVDVVVDVESGEASATVAMRQFMRSSPAFWITGEQLVAIAEVVKSVRSRAWLLDETVEGAQDHQLNFSCGGAKLIVVHPKGKPTRFVLTIGLFNKDGELDELSGEEIDAAVKRIEELKAKTVAKVTGRSGKSLSAQTDNRGPHRSEIAASGERPCFACHLVAAMVLFRYLPFGMGMTHDTGRVLQLRGNEVWRLRCVQTMWKNATN